MMISERALTEFSFTLSEGIGAVWVYEAMRHHWKTISVTISYRAATQFSLTFSETTLVV